MPCLSEPYNYAREMAELERVTDFLCGTLKHLETSGVPLPEIRGLAKWWKKHKAWDDENRAQRDAALAEKERLRALRASALSKLTDDEREALRA